ncbi:MAG: metallophosphoesterase, partial [Cyanobacteria bacterium J06642_3]
MSVNRVGWELVLIVILRRILVKLRDLLILAIAIVAILGFYGSQIEPNWFQVVRVNVDLPELPAAFEGFKIAQISDIHADDSMNRRKLARIVKIINRQKPDVIAMTGDFSTLEPDKATSRLLTKSFAKLSPQEKTLAVMGNHDFFHNPQTIRDILKRDHILELKNSVYTIERGTEKLNFAGVDDYWGKQSRLDLVMQQLPSEGLAILLAHEPDFADISSGKNRFALQMSGHSHGGQVRIPFRKPPVLPP